MLIFNTHGINEMLILTRRIDEKILIGDDIVVCVLDIEGNRVKLGLEAPKNIAILREEILQRYSDEAANDPTLAAAPKRSRG